MPTSSVATASRWRSARPRPGQPLSRQASNATSNIGPGFNGPLTVVIDLSSSDDPNAALEEVSTALATEPGMLTVAPAQLNEAGDTAVVTAIPTSGPAEEATKTLVHRLRDDVLPTVESDTGVTVAITGSTASNIDITDKLSSALPAFMALVIGLTLLLLTAVFRSILVPIKAALAILVSIASAFGVVVAASNGAGSRTSWASRRRCPSSASCR